MRRLSGGAATLDQALRDLLAGWDASGARWRDRARDEFAAQHLDAIEARARLAVRALTRLEQLLQEAVQRCA